MSQSPYEHLYAISTQALELSQKAEKSLQRLGVTTIGDCVDFFNMEGHAMITVRGGFLSAMYDEVKPALIQQGYWQFVSQTDIS